MIFHGAQLPTVHNQQLTPNIIESSSIIFVKLICKKVIKRHLFLPTGHERWPTQLRLVFTNGHNFANSIVIPVHPIDPGETTDLTIPMMSPSQTGCYRGQWRLANISNNFFGGLEHFCFILKHCWFLFL